MLMRAVEKVSASGIDNFILNVEADGLNLPFREQSFDAVTIGFGLRNLQDLRGGLKEIHRLLRPGGACVILEFSKPVVPVFRDLYGLYFRFVLPRLGAALSGDRTAYQYLPDSVAKFPSQAQLADFMRNAGYLNVGYRNLSGGIAALHWGTK
jgi:demethylmenaquinone methyltransferase/2-methoxy-6-polyprenyl-1,4-benzoquinol methylase